MSEDSLLIQKLLKMDLLSLDLARDCSRNLDRLSAEISSEGLTYAKTLLEEDRASVPQHFGKFEIIQKIGEGGMGVIYLARSAEYPDPIALKTLSQASKESRSRLIREGRVLSSMRHPNIVKVLEISKVDEVPYICMEYVLGVDLGRAKLDLRQSVEIIKSVCDALQYAHDQGVLHRDVKPGNILLDLAKHPFLCDFGLAKEIDSKSQSRLSATGNVLGTPNYMAPEQALGEEVDVRTDIYGLGATLYALVTGRTPFTHPNFVRLMHQVVHDTPVRPRKVDLRIPRDLEAIIERAMAKRREDRYPTVRAFGEDLGRFLHGKTVRTPVLGPTRRSIQWISRHKKVVILMLTVFCLLGIAGGFAWDQRRRFSLRDAARMNDQREQDRLRLKREKARRGIQNRLEGLQSDIEQWNEQWFRPPPRPSAVSWTTTEVAGRTQYHSCRGSRTFAGALSPRPGPEPVGKSR